MTAITEQLEDAINKLGTTYAGLLVIPELKELNHRLEHTFTHREIDYEASDLTQELKEIDDVKDLISKAIIGTINILEDKLKIEVPYTQTKDGLEYAPVKGLSDEYFKAINS